MPLHGQSFLSPRGHFPILGFNVNGIKQNALLRLWLFTLRERLLRFTHATAHTATVVFFVTEEYAIIRIRFYSFIRSHGERHLGFSRL